MSLSARRVLLESLSIVELALAPMSQQRVAICASGRYKVDVHERGQSVLRNLVEPLSAGLVLALTYREGDGCDSVESCGVQQHLSALWPHVSRIALEPQPTTAQLVLLLERLPHWHSIA